MKSNKAVGVVKVNKSDYIDEVVGTFVDRKNGCCALCGKKSKNLTGIALLSGIKLNKDNKVRECKADSLIWACHECHHMLHSMWFEVYDSVANGEVQKIVSGPIERVINLAKKRYDKKIKSLKKDSK